MTLEGNRIQGKCKYGMQRSNVQLALGNHLKRENRTVARQKEKGGRNWGANFLLSQHHPLNMHIK